MHLRQGSINLFRGKNPSSTFISGVTIEWTPEITSSILFGFSELYRVWKCWIKALPISAGSDQTTPSWSLTETMKLAFLLYVVQAWKNWVFWSPRLFQFRFDLCLQRRSSISSNWWISCCSLLIAYRLPGCSLFCNPSSLLVRACRDLVKDPNLE